jgi:two-component system sensor histidine kinase HydH
MTRTARSPERRPSAADAALAELARDLLAPALGEIPYRLYLAGPAGAMQGFVTEAMEAAGRDPWWNELESSEFWRRLEPDRLVGFATLPRRPGLSEPAADWRGLALRRGDTLLGGLLLSATDRAAAAAARRLAEPSRAAGLRAVLELRNAEQELFDLRAMRRALTSILPYGVLLVDPIGRVAWMSPRAAALLGVSEEEAVGSDCTRLFRPVGQELNPLLEGAQGRSRGGELYIARPDGEEIPVFFSAAPVPGRGARGRGVVALIQDLSDERLQEEAERQRDRLAALGELSAGVAHEIRNPLTGIANCAQVLQEGMEPDDSRQRFLTIILEEAARLNRIVEGLLRYARPNRPELRETSIEETARAALDLVRPEMEAKGIRLTFKLGGRIPRIYVDPGQIEQVLLNLLRNAGEAMPSGGEAAVGLTVVRRRPHRRRRLGRRASDRSGANERAATGPMLRYVQVRVSDTGHGIPKELLSRIFNPFYTTRSRGTGLGLSLAQSIVKEHGGFLTVRSVVNKGTVFHLDLPVERRHGERRKERR